MVSPSGAVRYLTVYQFHTCSVLRTMRERFDLGPALTRRDAAAPLLEPAFNRSVPRDDHVELTMPEYRYVRPAKEERAAALGDTPDAKLLLSEWRRVGGQQLTSLAEATLRNAARLVGEDPDRLPGTAAEAQRWLAERFLTVGGLKEHLTRR